MVAERVDNRKSTIVDQLEVKCQAGPLTEWAHDLGHELADLIRIMDTRDNFYETDLKMLIGYIKGKQKIFSEDPELNEHFIDGLLEVAAGEE